MRAVLLAIVVALVAPSTALAKDATIVKLRGDNKPTAKKPTAASKRAVKRKPVRRSVAKAKPKPKPSPKKKKKADSDVRLRPMP